MGYTATIHQRGDEVEIRLTKHRLIFTTEEYQRAVMRGKMVTRHEKNETRAQQRRAQHEADTLGWIE